MGWTVVVPVKALPTAKSRLGAGPDRGRETLALAFARDTVSAVLGTDGVDEVLVVTSDQRVAAALTGPRVVLTGEPPGTGLNAALAHGAEVARARPGTDGVVALCADLPALRPAELAEALRAAADHGRAYLADAAGTGTTLLSAGRGHVLDPRFGERSAMAHALSGAVPLDGSWPSLRRDVDSPEDLDDAVDLGVGVWTSAALGLH